MTSDIDSAKTSANSRTSALTHSSWSSVRLGPNLIFDKISLTHFSSKGFVVHMDLLVPRSSLNVVESTSPRAWTPSGESVLSGGGIIECRWSSFEWSKLIRCSDSSSRCMWCRFLCAWGDSRRFRLDLDLGVESRMRSCSSLHSCIDCVSRISPSMSHCCQRDSNCCERCSRSVMGGESSLNRLARKSVDQESRPLSSLESVSRGSRSRYFAHLVSFQGESDAWIW